MIMRIISHINIIIVFEGISWKKKQVMIDKKLEKKGNMK